MTEIKGGFNAIYITRPDDDINYTQVRSYVNAEDYSDEVFNLKYYSYENRITDDVHESIIEIFGQRFPVTFDGNNMAPIDLITDCSIWLFNHNETQYLCYSSVPVGSSGWPSHYILLFDITNIENIKFTMFETFANSDRPEIGLYPRNGGKLCFIVTELVEPVGIYYSKLYSLKSVSLEPTLDKNGRNIGLCYRFDKQNGFGGYFDVNIP
ncbi:MAG: hypothetical protein Ta2F_17530 [Termitinemataceae bacterium]|nr:MAG: hypothetical protein Ta2F_17530 [Termitinemataceae bacterium]